METEQKNKNRERLLAINAVEGFDPRQELKTIETVNQETGEKDTKQYLPLKIKQQWFMLRFPEGRRIFHTLERNENYVIMNCSLYADKTEESFLGSAEATVSVRVGGNLQLPVTVAELIGNAVNLARAKAERKVLHECGFGIQIEDAEESAADLDNRSTLPLPPPPKAIPPQNSVQSEEQRKVEMSGSDTGFIPDSSPASDPVLPTKSILDLTELTLEQAKAIKCTSKEGVGTLGDAMKVKRLIPYLANHGTEEEMAGCRVILQNT